MVGVRDASRGLRMPHGVGPTWTQILRGWLQAACAKQERNENTKGRICFNAS